MSASGDYLDEMRKPRPLSEREIEDFFAGQTIPGEDLLHSFALSARAAASGHSPPATGELGRILAVGLNIDKGDLSVRAASKVAGPQREVSALPKWRRLVMATSTFVAGLFAKLGVASAVTKTALIAAVTAGAVTAAGAAGALPAPVQNVVSHAVSDVTPIHLPTDATAKPAGRPADPGLNGLDQANSTPAAGHAPTSLPAHPINSDKPAGRPADPGLNGLDQANSTPAAGHVPTTLPRRPDSSSQAGDTNGESTKGSSSSQAASTSEHGSTQPSAPGAQSSAGLDQADSTPAGGHAPTVVPAPTSSSGGTSSLDVSGTARGSDSTGQSGNAEQSGLTITSASNSSSSGNTSTSSSSSSGNTSTSSGQTQTADN